MMPDAVYGRVADLFRHAHEDAGSAALLQVTDEAWSAMASRDPNPHDAEVCRLAMLAAASRSVPDDWFVDLGRRRARMRRHRRCARVAQRERTYEVARHAEPLSDVLIRDGDVADERGG